MLAPDTFIQTAATCGFSLYTGVPCSYLSPLINCAIGRDDVRYVGAANEGDAVAIASGAEIGGRRSVVMIQNSGLGNAVNPLSSLNHIFDIPLLLVVTLRGDPAGPPDEPQHTLMGHTTGAMLDLLEIPWSFLPADEPAADAAVRQAANTMHRTSRPVALVVKKDTFAPKALDRARMPPADNEERVLPAPAPPWPSVRSTRREVIEAIVDSVDDRHDVVIATTGYTGRVLYEVSHRTGQLALVGSMGCAAPFGLGLAIARPRHRIVVLDGDGALLMRLGALATIGSERPSNFVHVCLDNEVHDSTGGQQTVSATVDLALVAAACGYTVERPRAAGDLRAALAREASGPRFLHIKTAPGESAGLSRPSDTPSETARRLREHLRA